MGIKSSKRITSTWVWPLASEVKEMHDNYTSGGYGYGHAKQALYEALLSKFGTREENALYG